MTPWLEKHMQQTIHTLMQLELAELDQLLTFVTEHQLRLQDIDILFNIENLEAGRYQPGSTAVSLENFDWILTPDELKTFRGKPSFTANELLNLHRRHINSLAPTYVTELQKLRKQPYVSKVQAFLAALRQDFTADIYLRNDAHEDVLIRAQNWQDALSTLPNDQLRGIDQQSLDKLNKVYEVLGYTGTHAFRIMEMHNNLYQIIENAKLVEIKPIMHTYLAHLQAQLTKHDLIAKQDDDFGHKNDQPLTAIETCLVNRYKSIAALQQKLSSSMVLDDALRGEIVTALRTCIHNKPSWFELPLLEKVLDILSCGVRPLIGRFFSAETKTYKQVDSVLNSNRPQST